MVRKTNEELWAERRAPKKRGEGSVFQIADPNNPAKTKWRATRTLYMSTDGHAVQVSGTGSSEEEAIRRREENWTKRKIQLGELPASALRSTPSELKITLTDWLDEWLRWKSIQTSNEHRISESVVAQYESSIRLHIRPELGTKPIRLITKRQIEDLLFTTLPAKKKTYKDEFGETVESSEPLLGLSKLRTIQGILNMAFRRAFDERMILENPTLGVPKIDKPKGVAAEENLESKLWYPQRLAEYLVGHDDEARWLLLISCGLRPSEKLGATWSSFSHLRGRGTPTFEVKQQLAIHPKSGEIYINPQTKTQAGRRIIPLDKRMVKVLLNYKAKQDEWKKSPDWKPAKGLEDLVFTTSKGLPIRHQTDTKQWRKLLEDFGLEFVRQHAMRHLCISNLVKLEQPIEIIRAIAGHESESITRATYTHLSPSSKAGPIKAYADYLFANRD